MSARNSPTLANGQPQERDFAVLKVDAEEGDAQWRPGFYRVDCRPDGAEQRPPNPGPLSSSASRSNFLYGPYVRWCGLLVE